MEELMAYLMGVITGIIWCSATYYYGKSIAYKEIKKFIEDLLKER